MKSETAAEQIIWTQPCLWCGHGCISSDYWCPNCAHAAHTPKVYCTCGRPGCNKRTPADDYADAKANRTVPAMTEEQLAEAKRQLDALTAASQSPTRNKRKKQPSEGHSDDEKGAGTTS